MMHVGGVGGISLSLSLLIKQPLLGSQEEQTAAGKHSYVTLMVCNCNFTVESDDTQRLRDD